MDLDKVIRELHRELVKIDLVIESLEELIRNGTITEGSHRGRKSMAEKERRIVSERMKKYWASRRQPSS
jgi:hypothetical protein